MAVVLYHWLWYHVSTRRLHVQDARPPERRCLSHTLARSVLRAVPRTEPAPGPNVGHAGRTLVLLSEKPLSDERSYQHLGCRRVRGVRVCPLEATERQGIKPSSTPCSLPSEVRHGTWETILEGRFTVKSGCQTHDPAHFTRGNPFSPYSPKWFSGCMFLQEKRDQT